MFSRLCCVFCMVKSRTLKDRGHRKLLGNFAKPTGSLNWSFRSRWQVFFFYFSYYYFGIMAKAEGSISSWEEGNLGSPMLLIVSQSFIPLRFDGRIICFKWHRAVDSREAYCPPFMSLIKDAQRATVPAAGTEERERHYAPPHLHKASIHPFTSQDGGLHQPRGRSGWVRRVARCGGSLWRLCAE